MVLSPDDAPRGRGFDSRSVTFPPSGFDTNTNSTRANTQKGLVRGLTRGLQRASEGQKALWPRVRNAGLRQTRQYLHHFPNTQTVQIQIAHKQTRRRDWSVSGQQALWPLVRNAGLRRWLQDTSKRKLADVLIFCCPPPSCFPGFTRG